MNVISSETFRIAIALSWYEPHSLIYMEIEFFLKIIKAGGGSRFSCKNGEMLIHIGRGLSTAFH